ncbi:MAG: hypothetical protein AAF960_07730 [Bacteroidota bacterium]
MSFGYTGKPFRAGARLPVWGCISLLIQTLLAPFHTGKRVPPQWG